MNKKFLITAGASVILLFVIGEIILFFITKNPEIFLIQKSQSQNNIPLFQEEEIIREFVRQIEGGRPLKAAKMMNVNSDNELQNWAVQFSNIISFRLLKMEKANETEWTDTKHIYEVIFDVLMDPRSVEAPIPYYGWQNGENRRWITLVKVGDTWEIAEIATGP